MTVKTQCQGNSIMITILASFNIQENIEYQPIIDENGVISLMPVRHIFKGNLSYDLRKAIENESIRDNGSPIGQEDVWHEQ